MLRGELPESFRLDVHALSSSEATEEEAISLSAPTSRWPETEEQVLALPRVHHLTVAVRGIAEHLADAPLTLDLRAAGDPIAWCASHLEVVRFFVDTDGTRVYRFVCPSGSYELSGRGRFLSLPSRRVDVAGEDVKLEVDASGC